MQALAIDRDFLTLWKDTNLSIRLLQEANGGIREIAAVALLLLGSLDWRRPDSELPTLHREKKRKRRDILEQLKRQTDPYVPPYSIAALYANLGEKDHAFEYLQKAYEGGSIYMSFVKVDPELDPLRSDPRFADLLRKNGPASVTPRHPLLKQAKAK